MFFFILLMLAPAAQAFDIFTQMLLMAPQVNTFSEVTLLLLTKHGIVKVKDDNSMIISESLVEIMSLENLDMTLPYDQAILSNSPGRTKFVQTCLQNNIIRTEETTWVPVEGCIDNTLSSTKTTISRAVEGKLLNSIGPSITLSIAGLNLAFDPRASSGHTFLLKITCDIEAGQKMQLFLKKSKVKILNVKQRRFSATALWKRPFKLFDMGEWEDVDEEQSTYIVGSSTACVTNPSILQC